MCLLLLLSMGRPAPSTMIPAYRTTYTSLNAFLSLTTGLLHMLLPLLGTPFLRFLDRLAPASFVVQEAGEVLLSPGTLSASTAQVPQHHVLTFIGPLTTLRLSIYFLTYFLYLTLFDLYDFGHIFST